VGDRAFISRFARWAHRLTGDPAGSPAHLGLPPSLRAMGVHKKRRERRLMGHTARVANAAGPGPRGPRTYTAFMQSPGTFPDVVEIVVEIPRGSRNKYEYDEEIGVYRLDRVLSSAVFYNFDYGFIEGTRAGDGDHTDALLIIDEPTFTGCHVWARPIGGLEMRDEKGFDFKTLCVALGDAHQQHIERLEQVRPHRLVEIEHFFQTYKALEDKTVEMVGWREKERALEVLREDRELWLEEGHQTTHSR
jgi:inorganic pyrophosphatase